MTIELDDLNWRDYALFQGLSEDTVRTFFSTGYQFHYEADSMIISNQDAGETFFLMLSGLSKLILKNCQSETYNVTLFRAGDFFGELAILGADTLRSGDIIAMSPLDVLAVHKKDFLRMIDESPMLGLNVARELGHRLRVMNERMVTDRLPDDLHKVAHTLLMLISKGKVFTECGPILMPPLALREWAFFCYTSKDAFIDSIEQLKENGALEWQNQRIVIKNLDSLRRCATVHQERLDEYLLPQSA